MPKLFGVDGPQKPALIAYFLVWGGFTGVMFIGTLRLNRALQFVFGSLTILFLLLAIRDTLAIYNPALGTVVGRIAGYEGILCGASAVYTGLAQVLNEVYGRTVAPVWPVTE